MTIIIHSKDIYLKILMKKIAVTAALLFTILSQAQRYPKDFVSPLTISISLSANYGELRKNHFHSGLDMKTQQRSGLSVLAAQEGYISRINISAYGYGKAIYIDHPNGYTTVYGHLSELKGAIEERARKEQYKNKNYSVDFYLKPGEIPVKKGEVIALSGNTGGSGGPHLHFEVRDTQTEEILNPFLFGYDVNDHIKPMLRGSWIYPIKGTVNGSASKVVASEGGNYTVSGEVGFGVKAYDQQGGSQNLNGIYFIKIFVNDNLLSTFQADKHSFSETRYINASVDYPELIAHNNWIYRTYLLPGNTLQMYEQKVNRGIVKVEAGKTYKVKIEVGDYAGNVTTRSFTMNGVAYKNPDEDGKSKIENDKLVVNFKSPYIFKQDGLFINFEKDSFYEDFIFNYKKMGNNEYQVHKSSVPIHKKYEMIITPDWSNLDKSKADKYVIIRESNFGPLKKEYLDTSYESGTYKANPKDFGKFYLALDESVPSISCPMLSKSKKIGNKLVFKIKDTGSGINTYDVFIDGKWILAEYEYKQNSLFISNLEKEGIRAGKHQVEVIVTDKVNNKKIYTSDFEKL
ncbi:Peptidase family M23 [Apibacter mensalis]|uniref:Peptidase family M23 n=2 Tax=Apibacter mensalis TaxID=1586267 RepID=A0A0X3AQG1_9FLAO|nr:Peptidase family M23 [Apibacter mensalis]